MVPLCVRNPGDGPLDGGDKVSHAAVRNMMCCAVAGQEQVAAATQSSAPNR